MRRMNTLTARRIGVLVLALALTAASLPADKPEAVGLSTERLQRINQMIQRYVDAGQITGAITMVSRRGKVAHFEAQGLMDLEAKAPMRKDAIFRIASMSKPITGVAILMLMEEGKLRLDRSGVALHPGVQGQRGGDRQDAGPAGRERPTGTRRGDLHRARRPRDHDSRPADAHLGPRERRRRHARRRANRAAQHGEQRSQVHSDTRPGAARLPAGQPVALQRARRHRDARAHCRGRVGPDVRSVPAAAHLRSARDDRHDVRAERRATVQERLAV